MFLGSAFLPAIAQAPAQETNRSAAVDQLFAEGRWHEIVCRVGAMSAPSAELDYYYGTALAKLGRWDGARRAFLAGHRLQPYDKRLLIELAGVDFKQKRYAAAAKWLQRALRLDPRDAYVNDFLKTGTSAVPL